jgi:hypothetical protein
MEYFFSCPYCSEQTAMVLDKSVRTQTYIGDTLQHYRDQERRTREAA